MKETYSINDVALITGLTTRTLRNYIKMDLLHGEKVEGNWQFTPEQLTAFMSEKYVSQSIKTKKNAVVYDFLLEEKKEEDEICAVIDLCVEKGRAKEIAKFFCNAMNVGEFSSAMKFTFDHYGNNTRVILKGGAEDVLCMMNAYYAMNKE